LYHNVSGEEKSFQPTQPDFGSFVLSVSSKWPLKHQIKSSKISEGEKGTTLPLILFPTCILQTVWANPVNNFTSLTLGVSQ
jgi:hypothetical protein